MKIDLAAAKKLIRKHRRTRGSLIALLQGIQDAYGYVPKETVDLAASELGVYPADIYGILTFYAQFYLTPQGRHIIKVCQGTACHVMGGKEILDYLGEKLGVKEGEPTRDGVFSLERVACLGCCGMAPAVMIDKDFYGRCTLKTMEELVEKYRPKKS